MRFINEVKLKLKNMVSRTDSLVGKRKLPPCKKRTSPNNPSFSKARTVGLEKRKGSVRESSLEALRAIPHSLTDFLKSKPACLEPPLTPRAHGF